MACAHVVPTIGVQLIEPVIFAEHFSEPRWVAVHHLRVDAFRLQAAQDAAVEVRVNGDPLTGFSSIGWISLGIFAGLLVVGEVIESALGLVYVAKKGATRWGVIGGFVGGLVGAIVGSGAVPVLGTLLGGLVGAFGGAVLGEYLRDQQLEPSLRIGVHATVGKLLATTVKFGLSMAGTILVIRAALDN